MRQLKYLIWRRKQLNIWRRMSNIPAALMIKSSIACKVWTNQHQPVNKSDSSVKHYDIFLNKWLFYMSCSRSTVTFTCIHRINVVSHLYNNNVLYCWMYSHLVFIYQCTNSRANGQRVAQSCAKSTNIWNLQTWVELWNDPRHILLVHMIWRHWWISVFSTTARFMHAVEPQISMIWSLILIKL